MVLSYSHSHVGYAHQKQGKPCQDYSASYHDPERIVITCCDGHGGARYIRSKQGSKFASDALLSVFREVRFHRINKSQAPAFIESLKLKILCEYNRLVEQDYSAHPFRKKELEKLSEDDRDMLADNPAKAYGTTLSGAMLYQGKVLVASIGDTEALGFRHGQFVHPFNTDDDPAGNITYSLCQEDAYAYLRLAIVDAKSLDGVLLCTDGLSGPYQNYDNFTKSFLIPMVWKVATTKSVRSVDNFVDDLASYSGVGDDVSLSFLLLDSINLRYYRKKE